MTEDQKAKSTVLEILHASRGLPRTRQWIETELRLAGRRPSDLPCILDLMVVEDLIAKVTDRLGVTRYTITADGRDALDSL